MNRIMGLMAVAVVAAVPAVGSAQLLGGRVGVGAGVNVPSVGSTVDGATRTAGAATDTVADTARHAPSVTVKAGASTRVDRGTRCYWQPDDYYYDPVYRDGSYYCEPRQGAGVAAGASVATPR